jgi:antitoxin (DNA-binding transcriptional repressor) of toxin-antitoxin stability system
MSLRMTARQFQEQWPDVLDQALKGSPVYIIERNGQDCAVLVSARQWRQRIIGRQLDALGSEYRLAKEKQQRAEALLAKNRRQPLTRAERRELNALLRESDQIMLRRAAAMDRIP